MALRHRRCGASSITCGGTSSHAQAASRPHALAVGIPLNAGPTGVEDVPRSQRTFHGLRAADFGEPVQAGSLRGGDVEEERRGALPPSPLTAPLPLSERRWSW
jgi:hypothetical protein